jgi:hypothetical protein
MQKQYIFRKTVSVEQTQYKSGAVVDASELPEGSIRSMVRLKQIEEYSPETENDTDEDEKLRAKESREKEIVEPKAKANAKKPAAKPKKAGKKEETKADSEPSAETPEAASSAEPNGEEAESTEQ